MDMLTWEGEAPGDSTLDKEPQATGKSGLNGLPVGRIPTLHQLVIQHQGGSIVCNGYIVFGNKLLGHHLTVLFLTVPEGVPVGSDDSSDSPIPSTCCCCP